MLGVLMFGPGGGAATTATAGRSNSNERTNATFFVNGDMFFPYINGSAETNPSCNHETLTGEILSGHKVSLRLSCPNLAETIQTRPNTILLGHPF